MSGSGPPTVHVIAGPNGAGKSTFYETVVRPTTDAPFVNADLIQRDELVDPSPKAKVRERFARNSSLIRDAVALADRAIVYDSSFLNEPPRRLLVVLSGRVAARAPDLPALFVEVYGDRWVGQPVAPDP